MIVIICLHEKLLILRIEQVKDCPTFRHQCELIANIKIRFFDNVFIKLAGESNLWHLYLQGSPLHHSTSKYWGYLMLLKEGQFLNNVDSLFTIKLALNVATMYDLILMKRNSCHSLDVLLKRYVCLINCSVVSGKWKSSF